MDPVEPVSSTNGASVAVAPTRPTHRPDPALGVDSGVDERPARSRQWRIRCQDVANRERFLTLFVEHGRVVLVGPPGESAVLTAGQLGQLRTALQEAADEAER
ncbi:MAG TPA: hypothetical protein VFX16_29070 [Pseudonocardiaceae bacterium]|nr:hypothetical protein [Pseudonocardiaceae bacterium]